MDLKALASRAGLIVRQRGAHKQYAAIVNEGRIVHALSMLSAEIRVAFGVRCKVADKIASLALPTICS